MKIEKIEWGGRGGKEYENRKQRKAFAHLSSLAVSIVKL
jgi:hypothetical protein